MFRDFDQLIAPLAVLGLVWVICLYQLRSGLKSGEMSYSIRRADSDGDSSRTCRRAEAPRTFWSLFLFYLLVVLGTPLAIGYALTVRSQK